MNKEAALILAGHGSSTDQSAAEPIRRCAEEIRRQKVFGEVQTCFWKEKPLIKEVLSLVKAPQIYLMPMFAGCGYFAEELLPREFALQGKITRHEGREIRYCGPVGTHPAMAGVILSQAEAMLKQGGIFPKQTALLVAGHGSVKGEGEGTVLRGHVESICRMNLYAECKPCFMNQNPKISQWHQISYQNNVIIVPFFMSNGKHVKKDIPQMLGISSPMKNPHSIRDRQLWYAEPVGSHPSLTRVILAQVERFQESVR